ncbi:hypothetical protein PR370_01025 [Mycobacterium marinum]|uniref:hypothetical protein n=1 Tax=Mycobacterium marinum TaxID=1781 RepID=UPI00235929FB|nr:hypothetical protein [Mycobacterium marinum]MDC8980683.1 hypothetical protein [Mycobacterium marinum]MDC8997891.1 hypothetical protein [Mycobacterium marinum]MDC9008631.1 hypothetical protein [Mycobacterium marinum]
MTWGNRPRSAIPDRVKAQVRRRDKTCRLQYGVCTQRIDEFDHIEGLAELGIPRTPVLDATTIQGVCRACHAIKTEAQRREGIERAKAQRGSVSKRYRDREPHPGALS